MGSVRRHPRFAWLVLFALAAQTMLSYNHFHCRFAHNHKLTAFDSATSQAGRTDPSTPSDHASTCIICWNIQLANSATFTPLFIFVSPSKPCGALPPVRVAAPTASSQYCHFQARAPPPHGKA